jgi:hypothetical protein
MEFSMYNPFDRTDLLRNFSLPAGLSSQGAGSGGRDDVFESFDTVLEGDAAFEITVDHFRQLMNDFKPENPERLDSANQVTWRFWRGSVLYSGMIQRLNDVRALVAVFAERTP